MNNRKVLLSAVLAVLLLTMALPCFADGGSTLITATPMKEEVTVTILPSIGGGAEISVDKPPKLGETITFTITPKDGYVISAVFVNGVDVTNQLVGNTYTMTVTGDIEFMPIFAPISHEHEWEEEWEIDREPTCTESGWKSIHCRTCPAHDEWIEIPPLGHDFDPWETIEAATCQSAGAELRVCRVCGHRETRGIEPTAHEWEDDFTIDWEPTCKAEGSKSIHCKHCGATKDSTPIPRLEEEWSEPVVVTEPTETEPGEMVYTCEHCGEEKHVPLPPLESPETGGMEHLGLWCAVAFGSLFFLILLLCKWNKEEREEKQKQTKTP